ncbi:MAG: type II secretion system protein PulP [Desulfuromonadaceae bacterium]|nr:type II secretion system protein PulP [Desulfuromonadaceae bacterium]
MNRQRLILFILVIVFGIAAFWSYNAMPRPKTIATMAFKPGQQAKSSRPAPDKSARDVDDGTKLKISLLDKEPTPFKGYRRNIFKPVFVDEVKIAKQRPITIKLPPMPPPVPAVPVVIKPAPPPLAHFTFLGFLKKGSVKTVFLAKDNDILLVKRGDIVAGRYEATTITDQALTLKVMDTGGTITIPLIENHPLAMVR